MSSTEVQGQMGESSNLILQDYLHEAYEYDIYPRSDELRTSAEPISQYPEDLPEDFMSMVDIERVDSEGVHWTIKLNDFEGLFGSIKSGSKTIKHGEKYKMRHEFVSEAFQMGLTDQRLSSIRKLNDDDDQRTPDFIIKYGENEFHVLELTTSRSDRDVVLQRMYDHKIFSYQGALENRSRLFSLSFTVVVVSPVRVLSSVPLPDNLVKELVARMRLALSLEHRAELINLDLEDDDRSEFRSRVKRDIEHAATNMKWKTLSKHPLMLDRVFVNECLNPSSETDIVDCFSQEVIDTKTQIMSNLEIDHKLLIDDFIKQFSSGNRRMDKKPVTFFPFMNMAEHEPSTDFPKKAIAVSDDLPSVSKLWSAAMDNYEISPEREEEDPASLINEALAEDIGYVKFLESERHKRRRKYHRVDLRSTVNDEDLESLAEQGLWAKKFRNDEFMIARRQHQQSAFKWNTDLSDIEEFFSSNLDLEEAKILPDDRIKLLREASRIAGNSDEAIDIIDQWRKTKLYQALDIISDIAYEVAISNKQHCKSKEMILKKLRKYEVYLLISPTKSSEHTFVSLYSPIPCKVSFQGAFGKVYKVLGGQMTDFFSIKQGKLENQSSMPAALISLSSFWSWFYGLKDSSPNSFKAHAEALYMLKFSLLSRLEDKSQTEETMTQTRYMYMEVFKSHYAITPPNPFKILSKLTTFPRSRLNLFCLKKIVLNFRSMIIHPPQRCFNLLAPELDEGEDSVPNDQWSGLLNWVTGGIVPSASKAINLVYLGYLKNKMEPPEGNTDFQLVEKTCSEEFSLDRSNLEASKGKAVGRPKPKQFNMNAIKHGCDMMIKRLRTMFGEDWHTVVRHDILDNLSSKMTIEIASLKASANISHDDYLATANLSTNVGAGRKKVLEAIFENLSLVGLNPLAAVDKILSKIELSSKGVMCDLFKKLQHGGLREIYVLTIESRIVQLYVETISRTLCSYFEEETLTHPRNKLKKLDEHRSNTARIASRENCIYADFCSSTDKTRWNQNFVMPAMAIPLIKLTPEDFHPSICRILNLWTMKLIKLPQRVINLLLNSTEMKSETYKELHKQFWDKNGGEIFDKQHSTFMRLTSGMMQGILHYTSSLLHLSFLNSMNQVVPCILKRFYPDHSFMMTQVCSSDDSATILSVFSPKGQRDLTSETYVACKKTSQMLEALNNMAPYFCMINSVKTTTALIDYVEFNSEFLFRNTVAIPIIKFVAASLNITESESFLERFHTMYNLISDLFASGFPAQNTYMCQLAQAMNHYKTMGSSVNPTFPFYSDNIVRVPDPILGFFLVDCDLCPGVLGFSYSYWKSAILTGILRRTSKSLMSDATEVMESGGIVQSLHVKHGDVKRWRTMVEKMSKGVNFRELLEKDPEILFREPKTIAELKTALIVKSTMPSVAKSMRRGNPYMQALAMSVYAINTHCFSKSTVTQDLQGKLQRERKKISLLSELRLRILELNEATPISQSQLEVTFPSQNRYEEAQRIIDLLRTYSLIPCTPFRNRRTEVTVQPFSSYVPLSLQQTCQSLWFGHKVKTSTNILNRCVDAYKSKLPWIKDDIHETLKSSPFSTYQELANFISSHAVRSRLFVRIGPGVFSKRLSGQLFQMIKKSQKEGFVLKTSRPTKAYHGPAEIVSKLSLALTLPMKDVREMQVRRILQTHPRLYDDITSIQKMSKRDASLAYIQAYVKGDLSMEEITTSVQQTGTGILYGYTKMQDKIDTPHGPIWRGKGQCYVTTEQCLIVVNMIDDLADSIEVSSWNKIKGHPSTMSTILKELKLRTHTKRMLRVSGHLVSKFDGQHWIPPQAVGTPVYESRVLSPRYRDVPDVRLDIGFQNISLTQSTPRGSASLIRFKTYPGDVLLSPSFVGGGELVDCWLNQRPLEESRAIALLLSSCRIKNFPEHTKKWLVETLMARLAQKGLTRGPGSLSTWVPQLELPVAPHGLEISEEALTKLGMELLEAEETVAGVPIEFLSKDTQLTSALREGEGLGEEEELADWAFALHNMTSMEIEENIDITSRGVKSFKYLHPFWDKMIDEVEGNYKGFWEDTFSGIVHPGFSELSSCVMSLAGVKAKGRTPSLQERAELKIVEVVSQLGSEVDPEASPSTSGTPSSPQHVIKDDEPSWAVEDEDPEDLGDHIYELF